MWCGAFTHAVDRQVLRTGILLLSLLGTVSLYSQELVQPRRSTRVWLDLQVRGKAPGFMKDMLGEKAYKRIRMLGEFGYRTGDELSRGRQFYLNGEVRYKLNKNLDLGIEQRVAFRYNNTNRHRSGIKLMAEERFGRTTLEYRFNYQHVYLPRGTYRDFIRNRFGVGYDIPKWKVDPEAAVEFFTGFGPNGPRYDAVRYKLGSSWAAAKGHRIGFKLVHDREQNRRRPDYRWIFAFDYRMDLWRL